METFQEFIDAGAWLGRQQTLSALATQCTAAQARCLKSARESQVFDKLGLTWDEFCKQYAGISRAHADDLIRRHERFGDTYFRISELIRISPSAFGQIAGHIEADALDFDGEKIALTPANAPKIRAAIQQLRSRVSESAAAQRSAGLVSLEAQLDSYLGVLNQLVATNLSDEDLAGLRSLANHGLNKFRALARSLESPAA